MRTDPLYIYNNIHRIYVKITDNLVKNEKVVTANCLDTTNMLFLMFYEFTLTETSIRTARDIAVKSLILDMAMQMTFEII